MYAEIIELKTMMPFGATDILPSLNNYLEDTDGLD